MKRRDLILGLVSGAAYFGYSGMTGSLPGQVQAVFLIAVVGVTAAIMQFVGDKTNE